MESLARQLPARFSYRLGMLQSIQSTWNIHAKMVLVESGRKTYTVSRARCRRPKADHCRLNTSIYRASHLQSVAFRTSVVSNTPNPSHPVSLTLLPNQLLPRCRSRTSPLWLCWLRPAPSLALHLLLLPQRLASRMMTTGTALLAYPSLLSSPTARPTPRLRPLRPQTMATTTMTTMITTTTTMDTMLSPLPPTRTAAHRTRTTGTAPLASQSLPPLLPRPARLASLRLLPLSLPAAKLRALLARHLPLVLLDSA